MPAMWRRGRCQGAAPLQRPSQLLLGVPHSPPVSCHIPASHSSVPSQQCGKRDCPVNSHGKSLCAQEGTWLCPCSWASVGLSPPNPSGSWSSSGEPRLCLKAEPSLLQPSIRDSLCSSKYVTELKSQVRLGRAIHRLLSSWTWLSRESVFNCSMYCNTCRFLHYPLAPALELPLSQNSHFMMWIAFLWLSFFAINIFSANHRWLCLLNV